MMSLRLESRLTAAPRTGILDTMRSVEARNPRVGGTNPTVEAGFELGLMIGGGPLKLPIVCLSSLVRP